MGWGESEQEALESSPLYIKLQKAFRVFDKNGDGFIDATELKDMLLRVNPNADPTADGVFTVEDAQTLINSFDDNGDGKLSIGELCSAWAVIGGSDGALKTAMKEKREEAKLALKRKQEHAAEKAAEIQSHGGSEFKEAGFGASRARRLLAAWLPACLPAAAAPSWLRFC